MQQERRDIEQFPHQVWQIQSKFHIEVNSLGQQQRAQQHNQGRDCENTQEEAYLMVLQSIQHMNRYDLSSFCNSNYTSLSPRIISIKNCLSLIRKGQQIQPICLRKNKIHIIRSQCCIDFKYIRANNLHFNLIYLASSRILCSRRNRTQIDNKFYSRNTRKHISVQPYHPHSLTIIIFLYS